MIDENGYQKLIDMGSAKLLMSENDIYKTHTILGTPHYMAPEILNSKGYSFYVDLWSIGMLQLIQALFSMNSCAA
jgi:cGMP-dependent protein kinase